MVELRCTRCGLSHTVTRFLCDPCDSVGTDASSCTLCGENFDYTNFKCEWMTNPLVLVDCDERYNDQQREEATAKAIEEVHNLRLEIKHIQSGKTSGRRRCKTCHNIIYERDKYTCNRCVEWFGMIPTQDNEYGAYYNSGKDGNGNTLR